MATKTKPCVCKIRVPVGGHKGHLVPIGEYRALCGFTPSGRPRLMVDRSGWHRSGETTRICPECQERATKLQAKIFTLADEQSHDLEHRESIRARHRYEQEALRE